jgi:phage protein D
LQPSRPKFTQQKTICQQLTPSRETYTPRYGFSLKSHAHDDRRLFMDYPGGESNTTASIDGANTHPQPATALTKTAQKKLLKKERLAARKAEKKAAEKQIKAEHKEQRRREWDEKIESLTPEEKAKLIESRSEAKRDRIKREKEKNWNKIERLKKAAEVGQKVVLDLDFGDLMTANEIQSLSQQVRFFPPFQICAMYINDLAIYPYTLRLLFAIWL